MSRYLSWRLDSLQYGGRNISCGNDCQKILTACRSGELNAKQRELAELQALAQRRLKGARANFADGAKAAKEVKRDLEWTQKRVK